MCVCAHGGACVRWENREREHPLMTDTDGREGGERERECVCVCVCVCVCERESFQFRDSRIVPTSTYAIIRATQT